MNTEMQTSTSEPLFGPKPAKDAVVRNTPTRNLEAAFKPCSHRLSPPARRWLCPGTQHMQRSRWPRRRGLPASCSTDRRLSNTGSTYSKAARVGCTGRQKQEYQTSSCMPFPNFSCSLTPTMATAKRVLAPGLNFISVLPRI